jgi:hypothetical protein
MEHSQQAVCQQDTERECPGRSHIEHLDGVSIQEVQGKRNGGEANGGGASCSVELIT